MYSFKYSVQDSSHGKPVDAMKDTCATDYCHFNTTLKPCEEIILNKFYWRFSPFKCNYLFSIFGLGLFYNEVLLDTVIYM
jgi:hypothetical protein